MNRWWLGIAGLALGAIDTLGAISIGFEFVVGGRDGTLAVGLFLSISFAVFGFVLGTALDSKKRERQARHEVAKRMEQMAGIRARLAQKEKLASLGEMAAMIAHEVRNPLAIMRSSLQNLSEVERPRPQQVRQTCLAAIEEIDRLSRVTNSLLRLARPLPFKPEEVKASQIVERFRLLARPLLEAKSLRLEISRTDHREVLLRADPDLFCQVLLGLVSNAVDAAPQGSEIRFDWGPSEDGVEFAVSDQGPGIPDELKRRVFEPFFTTRAEGNGLGLTVARQIVKAHGGRIDVKNASDGACVRVILSPSETAQGAL